MPVLPFLTQIVRSFENLFEIAVDDVEVTARLLELIENPGAQGKQVHDANIVATMRQYRLAYLLTHNSVVPLISISIGRPLRNPFRAADERR
jgi:hypothetical protein